MFIMKHLLNHLHPPQLATLQLLIIIIIAEGEQYYFDGHYWYCCTDMTKVPDIVGDIATAIYIVPALSFQLKNIMKMVQQVNYYNHFGKVDCSTGIVIQI